MHCVLLIHYTDTHSATHKLTFVDFIVQFSYMVMSISVYQYTDYCSYTYFYSIDNLMITSSTVNSVNNETTYS